MVDNLSIFHLPVGVRPSEELKDCLEISFMSKKHESETNNDVKIPTSDEGMSAWSAVTDAGVEAVMEFTSSLLKGKYANINKPKKHGVLSVRAASMLVIVTEIFWWCILMHILVKENISSVLSLLSNDICGKKLYVKEMYKFYSWQNNKRQFFKIGRASSIHFLSASYYFVYFRGETCHICVSIQVLFSFVALFEGACIFLLHWSSSFLLVKLFIPLRNNRKEREPKKL